MPDAPAACSTTPYQYSRQALTSQGEVPVVGRWSQREISKDYDLRKVYKSLFIGGSYQALLGFRPMPLLYK